MTVIFLENFLSEKYTQVYIKFAVCVNGVTWKLVQRKNPQKNPNSCVFHIYTNQENLNVIVIQYNYVFNLYLLNFVLFEGLNLKL